GGGCVLWGKKGRACLGAYAKDAEKVIGNETRRDSFRRPAGIDAGRWTGTAAGDHIEAARPRDEARKGAVRVPVVNIFRIGKKSAAIAFAELASKSYKAIGLLSWTRPQR